MPNPFDQFDKSTENPFDRFDRTTLTTQTPTKPSAVSEFFRPVREIPGQIAEAFVEGGKLGESGISDVLHSGEAVYPLGEQMKGVAKIALGGAQEILSPATGAIRALYGDPLRRAAPGPVGQVAGGMAELGVGFLLPGGAVAKTATEVRQAATSLLKQARDAGYVFPPIMTKEAGPVASSLETMGGKLKTRQEATIRNQTVKNEQGAQFIGLPKDTKLTEQVFTDALAKEGKAYEAVKNVKVKVPVDDQALDTIVNLGGSRTAAAQEFKDLLHNPDIDALKDKLIQQSEYSPEALVEAVKQLRGWSRANFKVFRRDGDPGKGALAFAQKEAAAALDAMMERALERNGYTDLVPKYREARVKIAKIHDLESVTDNNGNVDSAAVASLSKRKRLTDELQVMAATHQAFEKAMGKEATVGGVAPYSLYDFAAVIGAVAPTFFSGHPFAAAAELGAIGARPLARQAALSDRVQNALARRSIPAAPTEGVDLLTPARRLVPGAAAARALSGQSEDNNAPQAP